MKKLLSIILAAAMLMSLIPSVFAEGETVYTYNFCKSDTPTQGVAIGPILNYSEYSDEDGRNWKYFCMSDGIKDDYDNASDNTAKRKVAGFDATSLVVKSTKEKQWLGLMFRVPEPGVYKVIVTTRTDDTYLLDGFYSMFPGTVNASEMTYTMCKSEDRLMSEVAYDIGETDVEDTPLTVEKVLAVNATNQEFVFVVGIDTLENVARAACNRNFKLVKLSDSVSFGSITKIDLQPNESITAVASLASGKTLLGCSDVIYSIEDERVATVENGVVTAVGAGETTLTATIGDKTATIPVTVTAPEEDELFTKEFGEGTYETDENKAFTAPAEGVATTTVNTYTAVIGETNSTATPHTVNLGEKFSMTAEEEDGSGNVFRYWALGLSENKKVLTRDRTLEFMPTVETKHVIAVYEPENGATVSDESFYNANGQLLTDVNITDDGKMPPLPSMTGYGTASAWVQYGTGTEFAEGADAPTENKMFVAKYAEPTVTYAINVVDGKGDGNYTYGQEVTCTATVPADKIFKCWTKTPVGGTAKIISLDEEYTFSAWESCTITAVFADKAPVFTGKKFSIILREMTGKVDNNTAYMAEFVGLGDAVEKGIQFGTKRVAMTTDAAQFTAVNDINGVVDANVKGYAILPDGTVIYDK